MAISSPQPSVVHLVTLFRQITSGDIRIPAFQREFVWKEKQIIELLDSVAEGFPIGSLLLWGVDNKMLRIAPTDMTSFPNVPEHYPTSYILDGMQRLSTLYGVFNFGVSTNDPRFDVFYDLEGKAFAHRDGAAPIPESAIPLSALFTPRQLLEHQSRLSNSNDGDVLIERLLQLQASFQEYMIPVVVIKSGDVHRIVGIFEKINSTGTRLDPVDFMRAITWAEDFDLNHYLDDATSALSEMRMELSAETIIKCVGLVLGIPPTTDDLLKLRNEEPRKLAEAFAKTILCMRRVSEFLRESFQIWSSDLVPYEGQLLLLFKTIGMEEADKAYWAQIARWYWATGFNESLRGKPDHYVVRALENWPALIRGELRGLEPRLKLTQIDLFERRLVSRGALSATFAAMFAVTGTKSLVDGKAIDPATYMAGSETNFFETVYSRAELTSGGLANAISARLFGNVVLADRTLLKQQGLQGMRLWINAAAEAGAWDVLASQFIDAEAVTAMQVNDPVGFMSRRVWLMRRRALELVGAE
ncbi:DUF262 domain-containing protein [Bradyrhizobium sp. 40]|uniref:DUF262 domain-containing protein n=1 Tax=Bradyrhizobium sp. 40 TaxID=2782674 RepID=UPI001FFFD21C|nr:DUF262 domain-containing protein [Bradyrhizobium sp. 40]UPJ42864.1 DUF262 domain-containing protein [Bradyrhizobium sp. 40]